MAAFLGFDRFDFGAMGLGLDEKEGGEGPGKAAQKEDSKNGGEDGESGETALGTKGQIPDFFDPTGVEEFRAGGENGGGGGDEDGNKHYQGA